MYILKTKSNRVINSSLETQEEIEEAQKVKIEEENDDLNEDHITSEDIYEDYDDEAELFEAFSELEAKDKLTKEQIAAFKEEKVKRILNLELSELTKQINNKISSLQIYSKPIYKKIDLKDVAEVLNGVLTSRSKAIKKQSSKPKKIDKSKLPFLPENLIVNAEKKRMHFENRVQAFYNELKDLYVEEPLSFLDLIEEATVKALVDTLLIVLHLINQKKIQLWKKDDENNKSIKEEISENNGQGVFISPI